jgi:hypothetical protein
MEVTLITAATATDGHFVDQALIMLRAGMLVINAVCLIYCVIVVPVELSLWDEFDFCTPV